MLLAIIILGFAMMTIGVALLFTGETPFISGKRIPALRARLIGLVLVSFLPLAFGVRQGSNALFGDYGVQGLVVTWSLFGFCWFAVLVILFPILRAKKERRPQSWATSEKGNPFEDAAAMEDEPDQEELPARTESKTHSAKKPAPAKKSRKPSATEKDPLDFS